MKFPFFASFVLFIILLSARIRRINKKDQKEKDSFWNRELEANSVRRKSLEDLSYIQIPDALIKLLPALESFREKKIVNFQGLSNTELKFQYGAPNIPLITEYDQNFADLISLLQAGVVDLLAKQSASIEAENSRTDLAIPSNTKEDPAPCFDAREAAMKLLEFAVEIGSDIPASYKLLAELYLETGAPSEKFEHLKNQAEHLPESASLRVMRQLKPLLPLL